MCKLKKLQKIPCHPNSAVLEKRYLTQFALLKLLKNWQKCLDKSGVIRKTMVDLSKAYSFLLHDLFFAKFAVYGFDEAVLNSVQDILSNRSQGIRIDSRFCLFLDLYRGASWGSILGPILLDISLNNLVFFITETEACNVADDTAIYSCSVTKNKANQKIKNDIHVVLNCFRTYSMVANPGKFQIMFLHVNIFSLVCSVFII